MRRFADRHPFPDPRDADPEGLLAYGGDLSPERLLAAYESGIFPWYESDPILWFSPDPRLVLVPSDIHVSRSLRKALRRQRFDVRLDTAFEDGELVGGLYGVSLGAAFFGESMFAGRSDASKVAFVALVRQLEVWGFHFVDCQIETEHLLRFGAVSWRRDRFLAALDAALEVPTRVGRWSFDR